MKKISNLLMMALLAIGMGLTSCDEQLDNAVSPGVMPDMEVTSITLSETSLKIQVDESYALTATVEPADADYEKIIWSSSDETIATVDENGLIHSVAEGNVIITAQAGSMKATCDVLVKDEYTAINQYKEATWDGTNNKVVFKKKSVASVAEITDGYMASSITSGWYSVTGDNVVIDGTISLTDDLHLILCDGAKLTINGNLNGNNKNLSIYGQANQTGQLVVNSSDNIAISSITTLEVHSCKVTATSSINNLGGFTIKTFNVYGGSVDAENTGTKGYGIWLNLDGSMNIYGGDVKAVGKGTSNMFSYGIVGPLTTVKVYGGKLRAECAGYAAFDFENVTLTKGGDFTGKIETSSDGSSWTEYTSADTPDAKYVRVGY